MKVISVIDNWFVKILKVIITLFMIALTLIVCIQVFARYIFHASIGSLSDMPPYLMIFIIWIAAVLAARKDDHIKIELVDMIIKNQKVLNIIRTILLLLSSAAMAYFAYYALLWTLDAFAYNSKDVALKICIGYLYAIIPFSGFFMSLYYLVNFIKGVAELCHR